MITFQMNPAFEPDRFYCQVRLSLPLHPDSVAWLLQNNECGFRLLSEAHRVASGDEEILCNTRDSRRCLLLARAVD